MSDLEPALDALRAALVDRQLATGGRESVLDSLVRAAAEVVEAEAAGLYLLDEATGELVFEVVLGGAAEPQERMPAHEGIPGLVVLTGETMIIEDDPHASRLTGYIPRHILCVPLLTDSGRVLGALALYNREAAARFTSIDAKRVKAFAHVAVRAIEEFQASASFAAVLSAAGDSEPGVKPDGAASGLSELSSLVATLARRGKNERRLAENVLAAVIQYLDARDADE